MYLFSVCLCVCFLSSVSSVHYLFLYKFAVYGDNIIRMFISLFVFTWICFPWCVCVCVCVCVSMCVCVNSMCLCVRR